MMTDEEFMWRNAERLFYHEWGAETFEAQAAWQQLDVATRTEYAHRAIALVREAAAGNAHIPERGGPRVQPGDTLLFISG